MAPRFFSRSVRIFAIAGLCALALVPTVFAERTYAEVVHARAERLVSALEFADSAVRDKTVGIVAQFYIDLHQIDGARESAVETMKDSPITALSEDAIVLLSVSVDRALAELRLQFIADLSGYFDSQQVDRIKEGLTYGRMTRDMGVLERMLPELTMEQRAQIRAWLWEARERALVAGSSEQKHWWFDKYRGRINNYLADAGYDLKAAEQRMRD